MIKITVLVLLVVSTVFADINVISDRSDFHLKQLMKDYTEETGEKVNIFFTKNGLIQRIEVDDFDVVITKNSSEIVAAKQLGLLKLLPPGMYHELDVNNKDEDYTWFNMSHRIRAFYVEKGMEQPPLTYYDLANPRYKGQICVRKLTHNYNLEMFGYLLDSWGEKDFKQWFTMFKQNLARNPVGNDRNQVKGVYDAECKIAIANTYYMGLMMNDPEQKNWAESVDLIIPNQDKPIEYEGYQFISDGAISLYSGVGVLKSSDKDVEKFLRWLISPSTQKSLSTNNFEYPLDSNHIGELANKFGVYQGLEFKDIKLRLTKQNELFDLRKEVYKIIK